jgi:LPPG:FO 2-phospho-L-lactate transferase
MLDAGYPLSAVTEALCARWQPGMTLLPASDDRVETHVVSDGRALHFQEWWVRHRGELPAERFVFVGAEHSKPAAGVLDALGSADVILLAPSNPVVSIAPILAIGGLKEALTAPAVGVSPIIGGAPVRGMADKCLAAIGVECTAAGVGALYGARATGGVLDGWLVDEADAGTEVAGVPTVSRPLWMRDEASTAAIVRAALEVAGA